MESAAWTELVPSVALGIGLAACAGLRAWLPLLLAGALARGGFIELGTSFRFIASNRALALFAVATLVEIIGDKFPAVDHTLDALSTILRPAAATSASLRWNRKRCKRSTSDSMVRLWNANSVAVRWPSAM